MLFAVLLLVIKLASPLDGENQHGENMHFILLLMFTNAWGGEVVENGFTPKGKPQTMVFERELRIGPEEEVDHHIWSGASVMVEVNKAGDIALANA